MPIVNWLKSKVVEILGGTAILLLAYTSVTQFVDARHWHKSSDNYQQLWSAEKSAHQQTELNYRRAADQARADDVANLKRVQSETQANNKERTDALEARLADARATAERLRKERETAANPSGPGKPPVSSVPPATGGPAEGSQDDRFSISDRLIATEQAIQLDELIKWVKAQHNVQVSK